MLEKYKKYLQVLDLRLAEYINKHKQFIACFMGCGICCENSYYAASRLEYEYIKEGFNKLNQDYQEEIKLKCLETLKKRREFTKTNPNFLDFKYICPFLKEKICSIYEYRPLLCRSHGLLYKNVDREGVLNIPDCVNIGLNYANIWDNNLKNFSPEKMIELKMTCIPEAFDLAYSSLMRDAGKDVDFGDIRMIFEWILLDIPDYEERVSKL